MVLKSISSYDRVAAVYDLVADPAEHRARNQGLRLLSCRSGDRVLEIGTGTGRALLRLAQAVGTSGEAVGLDASAGMLRLARERLSSFGVQVLLNQGDARSLPYFAACFDAVFMSFTLELFDSLDIDRVLSEVKRVLRPGGRLAVVCLAARPEPGPVTRCYVWLHRCFPQFVDCQPIDVLPHLEKNGFRPTRIQNIALWQLPVMAVSAKVSPFESSVRTE
jgi:demethylmenaquinone methyltransferase/2-methoxy-6-polyprenyl-1,4-benzoquinol methylase